MYLHLGGDVLVKNDDIVGLFDLDSASVAKRTREFLAAAEKAKQVVNTSYELPKSFCVTADKPQRVYVSQLATATLKKRLGAGLDTL